MTKDPKYQLTFERLSIVADGLLVHLSADNAILLRSLELVPFLVALKLPCSEEEVAHRFRELERRQVRIILQQLCSAGLCKIVSPEQERQGASDLGATLDHLAALSYELGKVAGCSTLNPNLDRQLHSALDSAKEQLESALAQARALADARRQAIVAAAVSEQLGRTKLIVGGGATSPRGWTNLDLVSNSMPWDIRSGIPLPDGSVALAYSSFLLEHLQYPDEALRLVRELHRVLVPEGTVRIVVPDAADLMRRYLSGDAHLLHHSWRGDASAYSPLAATVLYLGAATGPTTKSTAHKFGYDAATLLALCNAAGFGTTRISAFMRSEIPDLNIDDQSPACSALRERGFEPLFLEAAR
jgi:SAM-dependent methyltransferase